MSCVLDDGRLIFAFAHDLRSHLRTVLTRIQLVQRGSGATLSDGDQSMLRQAVNAVGDISGLLDSMVAYCDAKADGNVIKLGLLLQGVLLERKAALLAAEGEVRVTSDVNVDVPTVLQTVLKELLTNSCKFRNEHRRLHIAITTRRTSDDVLEIAVTDNGLGVDPIDLGKIFLPFQRLHSRDEFDGDGLGLATCRRIAEACGGTIAAESGPDGGLTVRVTVPIDTIA